MNAFDVNVYTMTGIKDDVEADIVLQDMRQILAERDRMKEIVQAQIDMLKAKKDLIDLEFASKMSQHEALLRAYLTSVAMKETKTQKTYRLPTASFTIKKPQKKMNADLDTVFTFAKLYAPSFIKVKEELAWGEFKKNIIETAEGELMFVSADGEMLPAEGVNTYESIENKIKIKYEDGMDYETEADLIS